MNDKEGGNEGDSEKAASSTTQSPEPALPAPSNASDQTVPPRKLHPVALSITQFVDAIRNTKLAFAVCMPAAIKSFKETLDDIGQGIDAAMEALKNEAKDRELAETLAEIITLVRRSERLRSAALPDIVERSLFLGVFSVLDAYIGNMLSALYLSRPELLRSIKTDVEFSSVLEHETIESLRESVVEAEIEKLRRKSYVEQFASLGERHKIPLTDFPSWPKFVECAQRRNLITHCDGIVSRQYLAECQRVGIPASDLPKLGERAKLGLVYCIGACELVIEVGAKLGQTLWRKLLPDEIALADRHLNEALVYESLRAEQWQRAQMFGEFGMTQRRSAEVTRRMIIINLAQAYKWNSRKDDALRLLDEHDWSACGPEFILACGVLRDDFKLAAKVMRSIGKTGPVPEPEYHRWPLFREFRGSQEFMEAYEAVFGYSFKEAVRTKPQTPEVAKDILVPAPADASQPVADRLADEMPLPGETPLVDKPPKLDS